MSKNHIGNQFEEWLLDIKPSDETLELAKKYLVEAWDKRQEQSLLKLKRNTLFIAFKCVNFFSKLIFILRLFWS